MLLIAFYRFYRNDDSYALQFFRVPRGYRRSPEFCALHRPVGSLLWETIVGRFTCSNWDIQQANQPTDELSQLIGFCASVAKWWTLRCMMNSLPKYTIC